MSYLKIWLKFSLNKRSLENTYMGFKNRSVNKLAYRQVSLACVFVYDFERDFCVSCDVCGWAGVCVFPSSIKCPVILLREIAVQEMRFLPNNPAHWGRKIDMILKRKCAMKCVCVCVCTRVCLSVCLYVHVHYLISMVMAFAVQKQISNTFSFMCQLVT